MLVTGSSRRHQDPRRAPISIDAGTVALLHQYRTWVEDRAAFCGVQVGPEAFELSEWPDGSKPYRPDKATATFARLRDQAGLSEARLHDLRHFMATQMIGAGHDIRTVAGRLGHAQTVHDAEHLRCVPYRT